MCGILRDIHPWRVSVEESDDRHLLQVLKWRRSLPAGYWRSLGLAWVCGAEVQIGVSLATFLTDAAAIRTGRAGEENDPSAQQNILVPSSQPKNTAPAKRTHRTQDAQSGATRARSHWSSTLSTQSQNHQPLVLAEAGKGRRAATATKKWNKGILTIQPKRGLCR